MSGNKSKALNDEERKQWEIQTRYHPDLRAEDYGAPITIDGKYYRVRGYKAANRKYPIICDRVVAHGVAESSWPNRFKVSLGAVKSQIEAHRQRVSAEKARLAHEAEVAAAAETRASRNAALAAAADWS